MANLTRAEVISILGPVDEVMITEVIGTQATLEELAQAWAWVNNDEALINDGQPLPSGRVAVLAEVLEPDPDDEP